MSGEPAPPILLASTSPQRRAILHQLGLPFEVVAPDYVEHDPPDADPVALVLEHARGKARSVADVIETIRKETGERYPVLLPGREQPIPVPTQQSDNTLITATCGWRPSISLAQSLRDMLAYERDRVR